MDLQAGERVIKRLEEEVERVSGLGAVRAELLQSHARLQQVLADVHERSARLERVAQDLDGVANRVQSGLNAVHQQLQNQLRETDQLVTAQLARSLGEFHATLQSESRAITERVELSARDLRSASREDIERVLRDLADVRSALSQESAKSLAHLSKRVFSTQLLVVGGTIVTMALLGLVLYRL